MEQAKFLITTARQTDNSKICKENVKILRSSFSHFVVIIQTEGQFNMDSLGRMMLVIFL